MYKRLHLPESAPSRPITHFHAAELRVRTHLHFVVGRLSIFLFFNVFILLPFPTIFPVCQASLQAGAVGEERSRVFEPVSDPPPNKILGGRSALELRSWADTNGIPLLEIDPTQIDTSQFSGWFTLWSEVPLSNSFIRPLIVADTDQDEVPEVYGSFKDFGSEYSVRSYAIDSTGTVSGPLFTYTLEGEGGFALGIIDGDVDGFKEFVFQEGDSAVDFEQLAPNSPPTQYRFSHVMWGFPGTAIVQRSFFGNLDNDSQLDFLYLGTEPDSSGQSFFTKTFVAEYDPAENNFVRQWSTQFREQGDGTTGGYAAGDFDVDGYPDFVASTLFGWVYIVENVGNDQYSTVWSDSLPFVNVYYQTSGDVDDDGVPEVFVGATMSNGNWTVVYEADSNDSYSPRFILHLGSGALDEPAYLISDIDIDGVMELVILSGAELYVFKSNGDDSYYLWYLRRLEAKHSVQTYDLNRDGYQDFIISKGVSNGQSLRFSADVFASSPLIADIGDHEAEIPQRVEISQNYPNPFNATTRILYSLPKTDHVVISIFNILGQEIAILENSRLEAGRHSIFWDARGIPSGMYFCRLRTSTGSQYIKMNLVK